MITALTQFIWSKISIGKEESSDFVRIAFAIIYLVSIMSSISIDIHLALILDKFI